MIITTAFFVLCMLPLLSIYFILKYMLVNQYKKIHCKLNHNTFNPVLENAILFAVGNTLVCDDLDEAKVLCWSGERFRGNYH